MRQADISSIFQLKNRMFVMNIFLSVQAYNIALFFSDCKSAAELAAAFSGVGDDFFFPGDMAVFHDDFAVANQGVHDT